MIESRWHWADGVRTWYLERVEGFVCRCLFNCAVFGLLAISTTIPAIEVRLPAPKDKSVSLPGGFGAMVNPVDDSLYSTVTFFGDEEFAYPVIFDTGASGDRFHRHDGSWAPEER